MSVSDTSNDFDGSLYGSIFFTHDEMSVISNNGSSTYDEAVTASCLENTGDDVSEEQCERFRGIGYIVK